MVARSTWKEDLRGARTCASYAHSALRALPPSGDSTGDSTNRDGPGDLALQGPDVAMYSVGMPETGRVRFGFSVGRWVCQRTACQRLFVRSFGLQTFEQIGVRFVFGS